MAAMTSSAALVRRAIEASRAVIDNVLEITLDEDVEALLHNNAVFARKVEARKRSEAALKILEAEDRIVDAGGKRAVKRKKKHDTRISIINHNWSWNLISLARSGEYYHFFKIFSVS